MAEQGTAASRYGNIISQLGKKSTHSKIVKKLKHVTPVVRHNTPPELRKMLDAGKGFTLNMDYNSPRFEANDPKAYEYLEENGYVVIANALDAETVMECRDGVWEWLEALQWGNGAQIDRNNPETWHTENWPADRNTGIVFGQGAGQVEAHWKARSAPNVKRVFANIWNTDDLITSFDGFNLFRPWKYHDAWKTSGGWWHVDQNGVKRRPQSCGKQCIQGLVCLYDTTPEVGGLSVIPKSHHEHVALCERINSGGGDFVTIPRTDPVFEQYNEAVLVSCKAGDLCLWDSRTIHCNSPSDDSIMNDSSKQAEKPKNGWELIRIAMYICFTPRYKATNDILIDRQENAFEYHVTSTHWPHHYIHSKGNPMRVVPNFMELTEYQKQLIGYPRGTTAELWWKLRYGEYIAASDVVQAAWLSTFLWTAGKLVISWWKDTN